MDVTFKASREKPQPSTRAAKIFAAMALASSVAASGCTDSCPLDPACDPTHDYHLTLGVGESTETLSGGVIVRIQVLDIYESIDTQNGRGFCYPQGGGARIRLRIESDPPFEQEFNISPNNCFSVQQACVGIRDVSVSEDLHRIIGDAGTPDPDAGVEIGGNGHCSITNEKVHFTLRLANHGFTIPDGGVVLDEGGAGSGG
jgi:hypothetical protein